MLNLKTPLRGVCVLDGALHGGEVEQNTGRQGEAAKNIGECWCAGLRGGKADAGLAQAIRVGGIA